MMCELLMIAVKTKPNKNDAKHNIINPPALGINQFLQFSKNRLQPWTCYFSGRIN